MPTLTSPGGVFVGGGACPRPGGVVTTLLGAMAAAGNADAAASTSSAIATARQKLRKVAVGDRTFARRRDVAQVFGHHALRVARLGRLPGCAAFRELLFSDVQLDQQLVRVDRDRVALANQRDQAADECLGRDVTD